MTPDDFDAPRLSERGGELEQTVLAAAREDVPREQVRQEAFARVIRAHRAQRKRYIAGGVAVSATTLGLAAAILLVHHRVPQPMIVTPESRASAPAVTKTKAPAPAPSGATPLARCTPALVADGKSPLIDDFEDGDAHAPMLEHRTGQWTTFNDGTGSELPPPGTPFATMRIPGGRGESHFAVHNVGSKFSKWGASLSLTLNPHHCYDASAYAGIQFWARGRGEIRTVVKVTQIVSEEFGGSCQHDCFDAHQKTIKLSKQFEHVVVRWEDLAQTGFGEAVPFDPRTLDGIEFSVRPEQTPFDFWIDDVSFLPR